MSSFICLYVTYKDDSGNEIPLSRESVVNTFDAYIPGDPEDDPDERFCKLDPVIYDELPGFLQEEYGENSGRCFAEMTLAEFSEGNSNAIEKYMRRLNTYLEALGLDTDADSWSGGMTVRSGKYDGEGNRNEDYSQLTWPIDKKLVLRATSLWEDAWMAMKATGIYRVIRDMVPLGSKEVPDDAIRMILVRH